jgi:hypothetical protein
MITERFEVPSRLRMTGIVLLLIGVATLIGGAIGLAGGDHFAQARFWVGLLHNSIYFLFLAISAVFIQAAAGLAQGGWIVAYRRVPEAIGANVWVFGLITLIVLFSIVFLLGDPNPIYKWIYPHGDRVLEGQSPFLNKYVYAGFSIFTVGLWSWFGIKFRRNSIAQESAPKNSTKLYWKMVALSGAFLFVYAITMMSITPWLWMMSLSAHWFSTLYSWYVFASAFVSSMALILLFVVYLKNVGRFEFVTKEHMHDLGKFMFAFSIFWTYLWFAQFLLQWYGNIPDETAYFKLRAQGPYSMFFYFNIILNFVLPILILMTRPSKRNYFTIVFMAILLLFGHWLDFYLMTVPSALLQHWHLSWYELGIPAGFVGLMILLVSNTLSKANLVPVNNPLLKESLNHIS